jgi:pyruvate/2-oxoglutarate dehydrogenase complex dihydrolipoamide dehydrogenase (E3) component
MRKVIIRGVRESWPTFDITQRVDTRNVRFQLPIDLDVAILIQVDAGSFWAESVSVGDTPKTLEVSLADGQTRQITAPLIFIDTGTRPKFNSTTIMELETLPEHLLIIGGGYIGLEFGQMFRRFGSQVTIIQQNPRLLMNEDEDVSDEVTKIFREDGITVLTGTTPQQVEPLSGGHIQLTVRTPQGEQQLSGSHLLAAIGREPRPSVDPDRALAPP